MADDVLGWRSEAIDDLYNRAGAESLTRKRVRRVERDGMQRT